MQGKRSAIKMFPQLKPIICITRFSTSCGLCLLTVLTAWKTSTSPCWMTCSMQAFAAQYTPHLQWYRLSHYTCPISCCFNLYVCTDPARNTGQSEHYVSHSTKIVLQENAQVILKILNSTNYFVLPFWYIYKLTISAPLVPRSTCFLLMCLFDTDWDC